METVVDPTMGAPPQASPADERPQGAPRPIVGRGCHAVPQSVHSTGRASRSITWAPARPSCSWMCPVTGRWVRGAARDCIGPTLHGVYLRSPRPGREWPDEPYAIEREVEDLHAVITAAGGSALVRGIPSGAVLALEAAQRGVPIRKLALYETPFIMDDTRTPLPADYLARLTDMIAYDRRGEAVKHFMAAVQVPKVFVWLMSACLPGRG